MRTATFGAGLVQYFYRWFLQSVFLGQLPGKSDFG